MLGTTSIVCIACLFVACTALSAHGADGGPIKAELTVRVDQPKGKINKNIYGHFAEHLGRCIYEGIWVGKDSPVPNTNGYRNDTLAALKELNVPVLRWPGGCFADEYHWRDGVGPAEKRAKRINTHWGGVIEPNTFGTHEFLNLCEMLNCEPYVNLNVGSGTPQEMMEWVEYITSDSESTLAQERRAHGRAKPWKVKYWGVGNESWGCGGNMRPEFYADEYRRYQTFVKPYSGNRPYRIACGASSDDYKWTEVLMERAGKHMHGLSLHHYTLPTGVWNKKGSATQFEENQWHSTMVNTLKMKELIEKHGAIMDKHDPQKKVGMIIDEWGTWYDPEPGTNPGFLYQQNTIRDAVLAGVNLNLFNEHHDRVVMTNIAQTINVLQAMILTDKEKFLLTPTYHVFKMYKVHQDATYIPTELKAPEYTMASKSVPSVHASASRDAQGVLHLSVVNLDPNRGAEVSVKVTGAPAKSITGTVLSAPAMNAMNTFEKPDEVKPADYKDAQVSGDTVTMRLPAKSVVVVELK